MPIFEYVCRDCNHRFESLVRGDATPTCPTCQGTHLDKQLSVFAVNTRSSSASNVPSACARCGDPRGPGACSMN
jgi:putative FmdB family regulatory protein